MSIKLFMKKFIAHRGIWSDSVKDNSYQALYNGLLSEEYIGIETDVRVTKDNVFVIYHDPLYNGKLVKNVYLKDTSYVLSISDEYSVILHDVSNYQKAMERLQKDMLSLESFNKK